MGPPGTGKTLLARAVAGEANVPFFSISGSDFVEMFVGVGASRVRDLFEQGKKNAPCIVFIDEIDAVGRHRGAGLGGGHDEREQTLNQLLVEMDGFESNEGVILVAATNRPDVLDPALLRPGRFDRRIVVNRPDVKGREGILAVHTRKIPMSDDVEIAVLARGTAGFSGADLANLVNEAALNAARYNQKVVRMHDFEFAKDKVLMGSERRSMIISDAEKQVTAIHEAGHALLTVLLPHADPIHKVTIIPRGMALGLTQQLPADEKHNYSRDYLNDQIAILLGGRIAEEITIGQLTTGAGNDLERATELARQMVCEWGMSDAMGPLTFGKKEEQIFLGREIAQHQDYSEDTALKIDHEVKRFVTEQLRARAAPAHRASGTSSSDRRRAARARGARRRSGAPLVGGPPLEPRQRADAGRRRVREPRAAPKASGIGRIVPRRSAAPQPTVVDARLGARERPSAGDVRGSRDSRLRGSPADAGDRVRDAACDADGRYTLLPPRRTSVSSASAPSSWASSTSRPIPSPTAAASPTAEAAIAPGLASSKRAPTSSTSAASRRGPAQPPVAADEERRRVLPVVAGLRQRGAVPISIDTYKADVARAALAAGAVDRQRRQRPALRSRPGRRGRGPRRPAVLMHTRGALATMYRAPVLRDVMAEVAAELRESAGPRGRRRRLARERIIVDPGLGFAKDAAHSFGVLARLPELARARSPAARRARRASSFSARSPGAARRRAALGHRGGGDRRACSPARTSCASTPSREMVQVVGSATHISRRHGCEPAMAGRP